MNIFFISCSTKNCRQTFWFDIPPFKSCLTHSNRSCSFTRQIQTKRRNYSYFHTYWLCYQSTQKESTPKKRYSALLLDQTSYADYMNSYRWNGAINFSVESPYDLGIPGHVPVTSSKCEAVITDIDSSIITKYQKVNDRVISGHIKNLRFFFMKKQSP